MGEVMVGRRTMGYAFVYDGMDYCKVVRDELQQITDTLDRFGFDLNEFRLGSESYYVGGPAHRASINDLKARATPKKQKRGRYSADLSRRTPTR